MLAVFVDLPTQAEVGPWERLLRLCDRVLGVRELPPRVTSSSSGACAGLVPSLERDKRLSHWQDHVPDLFSLRLYVADRAVQVGLVILCPLRVWRNEVVFRANPLPRDLSDLLWCA